MSIVEERGTDAIEDLSNIKFTNKSTVNKVMAVHEYIIDLEHQVKDLKRELGGIVVTSEGPVEVGDTSPHAMALRLTHLEAWVARIHNSTDHLELVTRVDKLEVEMQGVTAWTKGPAR